MLGERAADLAGELRDLGDDRLQRSDQREHDLATRVALERFGASLGGAVQATQQLARGLTSAVAVAREELCHPLLTEAAGRGGRGIALEERERDRAVDLREHARSAGPEALKLGAQLIRERNPRSDEVLTGARERPQRLGLIAIGDQHPVAVAVGPRELGQHEAVIAVALAARGGEPGSHCRDLVGVDRDHPQARVQQPLDQQPVGPLDRDQLHPQVQKPPAQRPDPALIMPVTATLDDPPVRVDHAARVLLASPINASKTTTTHNYFLPIMILTVADGEVPWRLLTDGALGATPCRRSGTSTDRREALV